MCMTKAADVHPQHIIPVALSSIATCRREKLCCTLKPKQYIAKVEFLQAALAARPLIHHTLRATCYSQIVNGQNWMFYRQH